VGSPQSSFKVYRILAKIGTSSLVDTVDVVITAAKGHAHPPQPARRGGRHRRPRARSVPLANQAPRIATIVLALRLAGSSAAWGSPSTDPTPSPPPTRSTPGHAAPNTAVPAAFATVNTVADVWDHPQLAARGRWHTVDSPVGPIPALAPPGPAGPPRMDPVPALGEHTRSILRELGCEEREIDKLTEGQAA
jgi:hypothetical protein